MAKLILMVGNIGTGKTYTTNQLMVDNRSILCVADDDLALMLNAGYYGPDIWTDKHWPLYSKLKREIAREALQHGFDIIIDGTHMSISRRKNFIDIAKEFNASVVVYLHTYPNGLERRLAEPRTDTSPEIWTKVYKDLEQIYEKPALDEGIDSIIEMKGE